MISFSGIDCSGKSTQIGMLSKALEEKGIRYEVVWSRGGYTPGIELLKTLLHHRKSSSKEERIAYSKQFNQADYRRCLLLIASLIDLCLFYSITLRIKEVFGVVVICDRYIWDTYIDFKIRYPNHTFERGFWWRLTMKTMLKPKHSFVFTIPAEESMRRSLLKDEPYPEPIDIRGKRIEMYNEEILNHRWQHAIDANRAIIEVYAEVMKAITDPTISE